MIAFEGIYGCGKTSQIKLLKHWLLSLGYETVETMWNSTELENITDSMKSKEKYDPLTMFYLDMADFRIRYTTIIEPSLKDDKIVLADRYIWTALTRHSLRGISEDFIMRCCRYAVLPDIIFYVEVPALLGAERNIRKRRWNYYSCGMDLSLAKRKKENFVLYQSKLANKYKKMLANYETVVLDGTAPPMDVHQKVKEAVKNILFERNR